MAAVAQALLEDYQTDKELTAFTALDGEEVNGFIPPSFRHR